MHAFCHLPILAADAWKLGSLQDLHLHFNQFIGSLPPELWKLGNLQ